MRVGKRQLELLVVLGSPTMLMFVPGAEARGLVKRGLLRQRDGGKSVCISAAGLRVLADEMDSGRVDDALTRMEADVKRRQAASARRNRRSL